MRIALLTGGGDSSAINAAIRAVVRKAIADGHEVIGIKRGWRGLVYDEVEPLFMGSVSGIIQRGGTILGTSRTNPFKIENGLENIMVNLRKHGIDAVIAIGGEDTNGVAHRLAEHGVKCVGIPQTIDNDLPGTDYSIGFDTAVAVATDALDKLHTTAFSHHRIMILEVMGRDAGWIALISGIAGGADSILIPEVPFALDDVVERIEKRRRMNKHFSIIVVSEGARPEGVEEQFVLDQKKDPFGHVRLGGIGNWLAEEIERATGYETRVTHLGHLQRGGTPTVFDRVLATRLGAYAVQMVEEGIFDHMACMCANRVKAVPYSEALAGTKQVDLELYELAQLFF
ncbi:MAG: 6-phosphofructokinase [Actinobacteria bacterium]|nr:6-phosphofructokinase [Actinomycetota bacterium]MDI6830854.1 ATP-dependent 6-phosphofructokinase [Actinomycetota bacterium]